MNEVNQRYRIYFGASLAAPFAAVVVDFTSGFTGARPAAALRKALQELLPQEVPLVLPWPEAPLHLETLAALVTNGFQDIHGPNHLPHAGSAVGNGLLRVIAGFHDADATLMALRAAISLAHALFARADGVPVDRQRLDPVLMETARMSKYCQPDFIARALIRAASRRGIPVSPLVSGTGMWIYGEGVHAWQFAEASSHRDSRIGIELAGNKYRLSELLRTLGLPATRSMLAHAPQHAVQIAHRLGYPVVLKPIRGSKGRGVSIGISDDTAVVTAFGKARGDTSEPVLVEALVPGEDYRLSVFGGKLLRACRLVPPHVMGNGKSSVVQLIDEENRTRSDADIASGLMIRITVDADMVTLIREQGFSLPDVPPAGTRLLLRRNSNLATGGKLEDVTDTLHPDNRIMAETIARALHLDAVGIDFMTTDPALSWRHSDAAVIEVNGKPGIGAVLAERLIAQKFRTDGRIPSVLVLDSDHTTGAAIAGLLAARGLRVGEVTPQSAQLGNDRRFRTDAALAGRIKALLFDPACEALVVTARPDEIVQGGLPFARFGLAIIAATGTGIPEVDTLVSTHVARVLRGAGDRAMLAAAVDELLSSEALT